MPLLIANVNPTSDTFQSWVDKTNQIADAMSTVVLTTAANTVGGQNSANAYVDGIFAAQTMVAVGELRGGGVTSSANLIISSNAHFTGANLSAATTYLNLQATSTLANTTTLTVTGTTANVTSNLYVKGTSLTVVSTGRVGVNTSTADAALTVSGGANVSANLWVGGQTTVMGQTTLTANVTFQGVAVISQANAVTTGSILFGNTGLRALSYDGTKYTFAGANLVVGGTLLVSNVVTTANAGIDGVNVAAFKAAYDARPILKVYDVNGTQLFTM